MAPPLKLKELNSLRNLFFTRTVPHAKRIGIGLKVSKEAALFRDILDGTTVKDKTAKGEMFVDNPKLRPMLVDLIEVMTSEVVPDPKKPYVSKKKPRRGTVIVPLSSPNGHDYTLGTPCVVLDENRRDPQCVDATGNIGNHMSLDRLPSWRKATVKEIEGLLDFWKYFNTPKTDGISVLLKAGKGLPKVDIVLGKAAAPGRPVRSVIRDKKKGG